MDGLQAAQAVEPFDDGIDIVRLVFNAIAFAPGSFGGEKPAPALCESVEHTRAGLGAIHDGVGDERQGLHHLIGGKVSLLIFAKCVHALIGPDIAAMAASTLDIVDVRPTAVFKHEHELMLRAVEAPHPGLVLVQMQRSFSSL
jgi:hypothetical protein